MKSGNKRRMFIKQYGGLLLGLNKTLKQFKQRLLKYGNTEFIKCLCECCQNVVNGNVPLSKSHKSLLARSSKNIRKLANNNISIKQKRNLISAELLNNITQVINPIIEQI